MNLPEARDYLATLALDSSINQETTRRLDQALQFGLNYVNDMTELTKTAVDYTIAADTNTFDITTEAGLDTFFPGFVDTIYNTADYTPIPRRDFHELLRQIGANGGSGAVPEMLGWATPAKGLVYPQLDTTVGITIISTPAEIAWVPGVNQPDVAAATVTLRFPDRFIRPVIMFFCAAYMHYGEEARFHLLWQQGLAWINKIAGASSGDANASAVRDSEEIQ